MKEIRSASGAPLDVIVIGSGAGGSAAASRLADAGLQVLLLEKGPRLPRDGRTLDVKRVIVDGEFRSRESWVAGDGSTVVPEEYFNLGGKTKWYGAALVRFSRDDFSADPAHRCPGWPIHYDDLAPYYLQAEAALGLGTFPTEPDLQAMLRGFTRNASPWRLLPLQMGVRRTILDRPVEARHFDGFASPTGLKADAEHTYLDRIARLPNVRILCGRAVTELLGDAGTPTRVTGVRLADGRTARARAVLLAAGALHSPRLLQHYLERHALTRLPMAGNVGRFLKLHLLTAVLALTSRPQRDLLRKTTLLLNDSLPHSSIQPLGFDGDLLANLIPGYVPRPLARLLGARAYGFFLQTEDGSHPDNRVAAARSAGNPAERPLIDYDPDRSGPARDEHARLLRNFRRGLLRNGHPNFARSIGLQGTAHACGTLVAGADPRRSVVAGNGKVHGLEGLYAVDGSVLPRVSRVNPALTIYAWGLRTAELLARDLVEPAAADAVAVPTP